MSAMYPKSYREQLDLRLANWEARADLLYAEAHETAADRKIAVYQEIQALKHRLATVHNKLAQLKCGAAARGASFDVEMAHSWASAHDAWEILKNRLHPRADAAAIIKPSPGLEN